MSEVSVCCLTEDTDPAGGPSHPPVAWGAACGLVKEARGSGWPDPASLFASDHDRLDIDFTVTVAAQVLFGV